MTTDFLQNALANATLDTAVIGGCLIGLAATWLYLSIGRIAGISGIAARALRDPGWPLMFIVGLGIGGWLAAVIGASLSADNLASAATASSTSIVSHLTDTTQRWIWLVAGGLLVGFGTRMGSGCTSGHGVCGIARLSPRSLVATCVFLATGMVVATLLSSLGLLTSSSGLLTKSSGL